MGAWAGPFPPELELSSLLPANGGDGSAGFVLNGTDSYDFSGYSVSAAGDVNGDGIDDLLIGTYDVEFHGRYGYGGESYVVFGRDQTAGGFPGEFELSSLLPANGGDGSAGFVLNGIDNDDSSGFSVSAAGDVNGDGIDDVLVGAPAADPGGQGGAGESYVVFGRNQTAGGFSAEFELSSLLSVNGGDGSAGFVLNGIDNYDGSGHSVSAAGDVNGDGIDDVLVGSVYADPGGESYVVFGRDQTAGGFPAEFELSSLLPANGGDGSAGFVLNGIDSSDRSGSVSAAGDVNGDGIDDLLIGASRADPGGRYNAGESYIVFGRHQTAGGFPAEFELSSLLLVNGGDGSAGFVLNGIDNYDSSGRSVSAAGDVNGDGIDDLLIGAPFADAGGQEQAGESYVVFGRDQTARGFPAEFELSSLLPGNGGDGSAGIVLNGIDNYDFSGRSVSAAGDVNGDGIDDLLIGAYGAYPGGQPRAGESYVVFGRDQTAGGFPAEFELSSLLPANGGDGSAGFVLNGIDAFDFSGRSVSAAGDVNGDGIDDLLIGAYHASPDGRVEAGESYVVFGRMEGASMQCEGLDATIVGTQGNDDIRGTPGPDVINALSGDDTIRGRGGDDIICGGKDDDVIYGRGGHDSLFGQKGDDTLLGAGGSDFLVGGQGNDALHGGGGGDQLFGDKGDDTLRGGGGNDNSDGGPGIDFCGGGGGQRDTGANCESSKNIP